MTNRFKSFKVVAGNFTSLTSIQLLNYIIPIITIPYLVRVLGPANFGLVNFALAFISYGGIIIDFGFNLSAVKVISINRDNKPKIQEVFNSVLLIKLFLFFITGIIFLLLIFAIPFFRRNYLIYILSFLLLLGNTFFPVWLFQGLEKMKYIAIINFIGKVIAAVMIFLFITKSDDYFRLILINSFSYLLIGTIGLLFAINKFQIDLSFPGKKALAYYFNDSLPIFFSNSATSVYTISNTFILGLLTNNLLVGYFSAADKIRLAVQGVFSSFSQSIYPYLSFKFKNEYSSTVDLSKKILSISGVFSFIVSVFIYIFAADIIKIVLGPSYLAAAPVLRIISFLPFLIMLSNILGIQIMLNLGYKKQFMTILVSASLLSIIISIVLIKNYGIIGNAFAVFLTELFVTLMMMGFVKFKVFTK